ncbi:MAG: hypothetical protein R2699_09080 [Acidimicrobiales bacterium]
MVGAGGDIGRQIAVTLIEERAVPRSGAIQLVARAGGPSEVLVRGLTVDLKDAEAEHLPALDWVSDPDAVDGDVVIFAAGRTVSTDPNAVTPRDELAAENVALFETWAEQLGRRFDGQEFVLVVSNPVELAVRSFARRHDPARVIGMGGAPGHDAVPARAGTRPRAAPRAGAGLRPGRARRGRCRAGAPCPRGRTDAVARPSRRWRCAARTRRRSASRSTPCADGGRRLRRRALLRPCRPTSGGGEALFRPPHRRQDALGTAQAVANLVRTIGDGTMAFTAAQVEVEGRFCDLDAVTGVPVRLSNQGAVVEQLDLWDDEVAAVQRTAAAFGELARSVGLG